MVASNRLLVVTVLFLLIGISCAWDNDELELFDLVEEVNANFYEFLGSNQDSSAADIRKAYRKLTLQLHPDKNKAENAEEKFRQLVAVYEVLKDDTKRQMYNRILEQGLPDWRTPIFYYRRARKMGFAELIVLFALVLTVGQYMVGWAVYIEKRLTLEDMIDNKKKKERKKKNKAFDEEGLHEEIASLPKPSVLGLWPFRLPVFLLRCLCSIPTMVETVKKEIAERQRLKEKEEDEDLEDNIEKVSRKVKRRKLELPEYSGEDFKQTDSDLCRNMEATESVETESISLHKEGEWTDEEIALLAKAVNRFPGGTPNRWEKIARMVRRSIDEVCAKSKALKETHIMKLSVELQGNVLTNAQMKMTKKKPEVSDSIITTADTDTTSFVGTQETKERSSDSGVESTSRQGHRLSKNAKAADKTLVIPRTTPNAPKEELPSLIERVIAGQNAKLSCGPGQSSETTEMVGEEKNTDSRDGEAWTQNQQLAFEWALRKFPKGTDQRWEQIAMHIPGKTKEDCIIRFKYLAQMVKKKKDTQSP